MGPRLGPSLGLQLNHDRARRKGVSVYTGTQHDPTRPLEPRELPQIRLKATEIRDGWERMHQRIGVMIGDSPRGPWRRMDEPLLTPSENWAQPFHADLTPVQASDGRWFLYYDTVDARDKTLKFAVAVADEPAGPYRTLSPTGRAVRSRCAASHRGPSRLVHGREVPHAVQGHDQRDPTHPLNWRVTTATSADAKLTSFNIAIGLDFGR